MDSFVDRTPDQPRQSDDGGESEQQQYSRGIVGPDGVLHQVQGAVDDDLPGREASGEPEQQKRECVSHGVQSS